MKNGGDQSSANSNPSNEGAPATASATVTPVAQGPAVTAVLPASPPSQAKQKPWLESVADWFLTDLDGR